MFRHPFSLAVSLRSAALLAALLFSFGALAQTHSLMLNQGWQVRLSPKDANVAAQARAASWLPAAVPGTVQTDLMAAGLLADPYVADNEAAAQWVGLSDWQYRTSLELGASQLKHDHIDLVFDGLDTLAVVRVNGVELLKADNMYRSWRVPAKGVLRAGSNVIEIDLASPIKALQPKVLALPMSLPGSYDSAFGDEPKGRQTAGYLRKAGYQYGWDWAPRIVTIGVWKPVRLETYDSLKLEDFHVAQTHLDDELAVLNAQLEVRSDGAQPIDVRFEVTDPAGRRKTVERRVALTAGLNRVVLPLQVTQPQRWWPVGYGKPAMYGVKATIVQRGKALATAQHRIGLRTVSLRREPDRWGRSFELVVNGVPVFAKGANLVPFDSFPSRVTAAQMDSVLNAAVHANMNIVRVWGGGYYPGESFYETADALGLMVWQDFMFGGALPPHDAAFQENTRLEAVEQVRRLRRHPSVVLWCGNNEVQVSWEKWPDRLAFKAAVDPVEREKIAVGMAVLFGQILRSAVTDNDPGTPYFAGSPSTDYRGPADQIDDGDMHFWQVWIDAPLEDYLTTTPRFMSEFGLQSMPAMTTIKSFMAPRGVDDIPVQLVNNGYDAGNGNGRLLRYIRASYGEPATFADYVYLSQLLQAEGLEMAVLNQRSSRPQSMGTLYWTLNDAWPGQINKLWAGPAWGSVDHPVRWKAAHHRARRFYAPVVLTALRRSGVTDIKLVSDRTQAFDTTWRLRVVDFDGRVLQERQGQAHAAPLSATPLATFTDAELLGSADPHRSVAVVESFEAGRSVSRSFVYFAPAKDLALSAPQLDTQWAAGPAGTHRLTVTAKSLARGVWIDFGDLDAGLSDNAFDLAPGEAVTLTVTSQATAAELKRAVSVRSLYGAARVAVR